MVDINLPAVASQTPLRNRRFQLPVIPEAPASPDAVPEQAAEQVLPASPGPDQPMEPAPLQDMIFGFSPFELELLHAKHDHDLCLDFYETIMACTGTELDGNWFQHDHPTPLVMDGHKVKLAYNVSAPPTYNGVDADVRCFNEKERDMMEGSGGEPAWRLIMTPSIVESSWCLYGFDMQKKRITIMDPVYTPHSDGEYEQKHGTMVALMLDAVKTIGEALDDGWQMNLAEWTTRNNRGWHLPCSVAESAAYMLHYAENFDCFGLEVPIPEGGMTVTMKKQLYEVIAMAGNTGTRPGFMLRDD